MKTVSLEEKIAAMSEVVDVARRGRRVPGEPAARRYHVLASIASDLRGRQALPRNNALGQLERALERLAKAPQTDGCFDRGLCQDLAQTLISKWPTVAQALENFGEESPE
jgi:hypothetical protein